MSAALVLLVTAAATAGPTTAPEPLDPAVRHTFDRLADPDPDVRDAARQQLMGLPADALPKLLAVVRAADPLLPAQAASLHEIVCHVWLTGDRYVAVGDADDPNHQTPHYVMGLRWSGDPAAGARLGVPVTERWPGFPARRLLRDGDLILGVYVRKDLPLQQLPNLPTHRFTDLQAVIADSPAVHDIDLSVLRDGREVRLSMTLVPQAVDAISPAVAAVDAFLAAREQRAEKYWQDTFAPLVDPAADDAPTSLDR